MASESMRGTTILGVRRGNQVVIAADGQVTLGNTVVKHGASKLRRLYGGKVIAGFAGATADAFTLFERFEARLKDYHGNVTRAAVELAKDWRTDRALRRLEAMIYIADTEKTLLISGTGDVIEPDHGAVAIGSGGNFALSAARVLLSHSELAPREIATEAMKFAAELCIYTNSHLIFEELGNHE